MSPFPLSSSAHQHSKGVRDSGEATTVKSLSSLILMPFHLWGILKQDEDSGIVWKEQVRQEAALYFYGV
jgi:hypothetical protein